MRIWGVLVVGIICFYAGLFVAALLANRKIEDAIMDRAFRGAWK